MIKRKSCPFRLSVSKGLIVEKKRIAFLYEKRNHINRALLGTKFDYTEAETTLLFFLKFILSKSWARPNSFISDFTSFENMSFFKKHRGN